MQRVLPRVLIVPDAAILVKGVPRQRLCVVILGAAVGGVAQAGRLRPGAGVLERAAQRGVDVQRPETRVRVRESQLGAQREQVRGEGGDEGGRKFRAFALGC